MSDAFFLALTYEGKDYEFEIAIVPFGYVHRLMVTIEGIELAFEMDEERNYRILDLSQEQHAINKIKPGLLQAIVDKLQSLHD